MKHFILSVPPNPEGMIHLYDKDYHYLVRVRRLKAGMYFDAVLPGGEETRIRVLSTVDNILIGECQNTTKQDLSSTPEGKSGFRPRGELPPIALFQGLPKGAKMDLIARQAAECGVSAIIPFESEYSTIHLKKDSSEKLSRWERIIREARQQSGSATETEIRTPCSFNAVLDAWESHKKNYRRPLGILLHQEPLGKGPLAKGNFHDYLGNYPDFIALAVGPEGGFSPGEVSLFLAAGFRPLVMGNTILRTETAALCGTAAIRIILSESESWKPLSRE